MQPIDLGEHPQFGGAVALGKGHGGGAGQKRAHLF
jgi:hypothetical protein